MKTALFGRVGSLVAALLLTACVSQSTIEVKVAEQAGHTGPVQRAQIHTERAGEYYRMGNLTVALDAAQQAVSVLPTHAPAYNMLGIIQMQLGQDLKAAQAFEQALKLAPNDPDTLNNYGWFVCQRQDPAVAMQYFRAALKDPLYSSPERAMHNAGVCARKNGDLINAEGQFRAALARQPSYGPSLLALAELVFSKGRVKEAEALLVRHMQVMQASGADALLLGVRIARAVGDKTAEVSYVQQLRRRFPDSPQARASTEVR
ncbi:MAG: type IV pilus biogenesis/stability protein PilW [Phycisphaerae bacterium]|nr:type IV pilus biogenesis/stability protein PilW [Gemmatimonadaceae bacterium]